MGHYLKRLKLLLIYFIFINYLYFLAVEGQLVAHSTNPPQILITKYENILKSNKSRSFSSVHF